MKIRIDDLAAAPALRLYLAERTNFVVREREAGTMTVSVLASLRDGGRLELERYLRPWRDRHRDVVVDVVPDR